MDTSERRTFSLAEIAERFGGEVIGDATVRVNKLRRWRRPASPHRLLFEPTLSPPAGADACRRRTRQRRGGRCHQAATHRLRGSLRILRTIVHVPEPAEAVVPATHPDAERHPTAAWIQVAVSGPSWLSVPGAVIGPRTLIQSGLQLGAKVKDWRRLPDLCERLDLSWLPHRRACYSSFGRGDRSGWLWNCHGEWPLEKNSADRRVLIGDDVEVGANTTIDRGALDDTVIEEGVKLDNQIQIGHNCRIGAHTAIAGCVGIAGQYAHRPLLQDRRQRHDRRASGDRRQR